MHNDLIFILTIIQGGYPHHPNFTNKETEAKGRMKGSDRGKALEKFELDLLPPRDE